MTFCKMMLKDFKILQKGWMTSNTPPGKPYWRGRLSTIDLLVLTSLDQVLLYCNYYLTFFTKHSTLMRRSTVLILPLKLIFPDWTYSAHLKQSLSVWLRYIFQEASCKTHHENASRNRKCKLILIFVLQSAFLCTTFCRVSFFWVFFC